MDADKRAPPGLQASLPSELIEGCKCKYRTKVHDQQGIALNKTKETFYVTYRPGSASTQYQSSENLS